MNQRLPVIYIILLSVVFLFSGNSVVLGQGTDIKAYSFPEESGSAAIGIGTVDIEVVYGTNLNGLIATFTLSDSAVADIGGTPQVSGVTSNDFTSGQLIYTVTDTTDGSTQNWDINVTIAPNTENDILTFDIGSNIGIVNATDHTVAVTVPFGTDVTALVADFTLSPQASASVGGTPQVSGTTPNNFTNPVTYVVQAGDGTNQNWTVSVSFAPNTANDILTFDIGSNIGTVNATDHTVAVTVPFGTNVTALVADFTLSPQASASVGGTPQVSGTTPNNFTNPVTYVVQAGDGTNQNWTVTVSFAVNTETDFLTYSIPGQTQNANINNGLHTIQVLVPYGTNLNGLIADFTLSPQAAASVGGTPQVSGTTPNNFTNPVTYVVQAGDGSIQNWTVTVSFAANTETDILTYSVDGFNGIVNNVNHTVNVTVPYGTIVTDMVATFTLSDQATARVSGSLQESGVSSLNFSSPVTYNIIAGDGTTTQTWTVSVNIAPNTATDFETFSFANQTGPATINTTNHTINIEVQYETNLTNLVATFDLSPGATARISGTLQTSGITANNFTNPVTYRVLAEDGTTAQNWTVTVTEAPNFETDIVTYTIPNQLGGTTINNVTHTIEVVMPFGTNRSSLVASFTLSEGALANVGATPQNSGVTANNFNSDVIYTVLAENGVDTQDWTVTVTVAPNTSTSILLYSFNENSEPSDINDTNHTVDVVVVYGTDVRNLVANFVLSTGAEATVDGVVQQSGVTSNNFTNPVTYTVTAQDGTTSQDWTVTVTVAENTEANIIAYSFDEQTGPATINNIDREINIEVAYETDITDLVAIFELSDSAEATVGVTPQISGVTSNNFTNEVTYVVTSEDGLTELAWIVIVTVADNTETDILTYGFPDPTDTVIINSVQHTIDVTIEYGTDLTSLIADFTLSPDADAFVGPVRQESGVSLNDFSNEVIYTVLAGDGITSQDWIVDVTYNEPDTLTDILSFTFDEQIGTTFKDTINNRIRLYVQQDAELDRLIALFVLSEGATAYVDTVLQESGETANNFTDSLVYTVVAQDGITVRNWTVIVLPGFSFEYVESPDEYPVSNSSITASARLPIYRDIENVIFYYKKFEDTGWSSLIVQGNQEIYEVDITRDMVGDLGMYYYFNAVDTTGSNISLDQIQLILHYDTDYPAIPNLRFGETVNQYQIISVPLTLQNTNAEAVFDELGDYNIKNWRLFHYNNGSTNEYRNGFTNIDPGFGYWLIIREPESIDTGEGRTVRIDSVTGYQIELNPGWNQIGNPFDMDINWDGVIFDNENLNVGRIKLFNRDSLSESNTLPRYRGGFVFLEGVQPVTVDLIPHSIAAGRRQQYVNQDRLNSLDEPSWIAGLKLSNGIVSHNLSGIGMHPEAIEGKDRHDEVLLPVPEEIIPFELAFNHPDEQYQKFSMDVIQTTDQYIWEFEVKSFGPAQTLSINWDNRYFGDNEFNLILNHKGVEKLINMKEVKSYTFNVSGTEQFRIIFGDDTFVSNELKPRNVTIGQGYPNPFRDVLTIPFSLPESDSKYNVNISVYDLTGNMVKQLTNEDYDPGYYTVQWNSLNEAGTVGRGIYLIRMVVKGRDESIVLTKKAIRY